MPIEVYNKVMARIIGRIVNENATGCDAFTMRYVRMSRWLKARFVRELAKALDRPHVKRGFLTVNDCDIFCH